MWFNKNSSLKLPFPSALFVFALLPSFFELEENLVKVTTMTLSHSFPVHPLGTNGLMWFNDNAFKVIPLLKIMLHKKTPHIIRIFFQTYLFTSFERYLNISENF